MKQDGGAMWIFDEFCLPEQTYEQEQLIYEKFRTLANFGSVTG